MFKYYNIIIDFEWLLRVKQRTKASRFLAYP